MSLINDALKRTQKMEESQPPVLGELELRPIEPGQTPEPNQGGGPKRIIWGIVLAVVAVNIVLWLVFKGDDSETEARARAVDTEVVEAIAEEPAPGASAEASPVDVVEAAPPEEAETLVTEPQPEPAIVVPPVIEHPEFRVQSIVSHPVRPSVMINGRVLFIGDRVEGYTVTEVGKYDVTLVLDENSVTVSLP